MTFVEQWLDMAVGALRAAGLAAAALGYHVWRLLTKQESESELEDFDEVSSRTTFPHTYSFPAFMQSGAPMYLNRYVHCRACLVCRVFEAILWVLKSSCPLSVGTAHKLLALAPGALKYLPG